MKFNSLGAAKRLVAVIAVCIGAMPALAFSSFENQGGRLHAEITEEGLRGTVAQPNLKLIVDANEAQDRKDGEGARDHRRHFASKNVDSALAYIDREKKSALNFAAEADTAEESRAGALRHFGMVLHTAQDFYSQSNYVELQLQEPRFRADPLLIPLVDWSRVPAGYAGLIANAADSMDSAQNFNKDNPSSEQGKKLAGKTSYYNIARELAIRETQRQWTLFETLIRSRCGERSAKIIAALREATPSAATI
jgi:hypothetical protein